MSSQATSLAVVARLMGGQGVIDQLIQLSGEHSKLLDEGHDAGGNA